MDLAGEIAKAIFEQDGQAIFAAFQKMLRKGSPYAFQVLSDRAYGKLKDTHQVDVSPYRDMSDADLAVRIKQLEQQLGFSTHEELPPSSDRSPIKRCAGLSHWITYPPCHCK